MGVVQVLSLFILLLAICLSLISLLHESSAAATAATAAAAAIPQLDTHTFTTCRAEQQNNNNNNNHLICEFQQANFQISRLEPILEESIQALNAKGRYIKEMEKLIEEMTHEIDGLKSALIGLQASRSETDKKLEMLEEEVRLLWPAARKNNFEIHTLESKAQDSEKRLKTLASEVQGVVDIVTEQWIQIRQLQQAAQLAEMRTLKIRRQISFTRCTFLKFMKTLLGSSLEKLIGDQKPPLFGKRSASSSHMSQIWSVLERTYSAAKAYHHQLQAFIMQALERNDFTAPLANEEVVFFLASAVLTFPLMTAWMLLSS